MIGTGNTGIVDREVEDDASGKFAGMRNPVSLALSHAGGPRSHRIVMTPGLATSGINRSRWSQSDARMSAPIIPEPSLDTSASIRPDHAIKRSEDTSWRDGAEMEMYQHRGDVLHFTAVMNRTRANGRRNRCNGAVSS